MKRLYIAIFFIILASVLSISECIFIDLVYDDYTSKHEELKTKTLATPYTIYPNDIHWDIFFIPLCILYLNHTDTFNNLFEVSLLLGGDV